MRFEPLPLHGAFRIWLEPNPDERGFFTRVWCRREFAAHGIDAEPVQRSVSFNLKAGTLRGLHFQKTPHEEAKLIRCLRGSLFDVMLDMRPDSATFGQWYAATLTAGDDQMLFIPNGFAHGFQTLVDATEMEYQITAYYDAASAHGVRWNDPHLQIPWPIRTPIMSDRDRAFADFASAATPNAR
jgi:dTDP-4-dehydrorhamnose 3,5-epimerase